MEALEDLHLLNFSITKKLRMQLNLYKIHTSMEEDQLLNIQKKSDFIFLYMIGILKK